jgi:hypothetical protein
MGNLLSNSTANRLNAAFQSRIGTRPFQGDLFLSSVYRSLDLILTADTNYFTITIPCNIGLSLMAIANRKAA